MTGQAGVVSILIVNWNTRDLLIDCLRSIAENATDVPCEVIVFDNASSDGSAEAVRERFPDVKLITSEANLGFAAGNNRALAKSSGEFVMFLNPDTIVPPGAIRRMVEFLNEHEEVGFVGPRLVGANGKTQISSFGMFPSPLEAAAHAIRIWRVAPRSHLASRFSPTPDAGESWVYTQHLLGACVMARRAALDEIGGMDEGFFLFLEETDLFYRAALSGWKVVYLPEVCVVHYGEQSMQDILHRTGGLYIRSYNRFCRKHGMGTASRMIANVFLVLGIFAEVLTGIVKWRSPRRAWNCLKALWYGYVAVP
ncbi:MAG: glycosyltransferase family 2 protein [Armatimonadota bacterium]